MLNEEQNRKGQRSVCRGRRPARSLTHRVSVGMVVDARDAEIADLEHERVDVDEDVGGREIAVDHVGAVHVLQSTQTSLQFSRWFI